MARLLPIVLLTALIGSGGLAAGSVAAVPTIVEIVFVGCLILFVVTLVAAAFAASPPDKSQPHG